MTTVGRVLGLVVALVAAASLLFGWQQNRRSAGTGWPSGICDTPECWRGR